MKLFLKKLRAMLERRANRARALRIPYPAACGYEAAWPALEPIPVHEKNGAQDEAG
jgi:hypothetical protein